MAAAALPLVIHLFSRRTKERIPFSSLYFLRLLESKKIRRLKLKQLLLLLIRMLVVALLVFAFARPTLTKSPVSGYSGDTRISAVIIIDNSLSTSAEYAGTALFELVKRQALEILETLRDGDEMYFLATAAVEESKGTGALFEREAVRRKIRDTELSQKTVDLAAALQAGYDLLESSSNLYRELFLVSDLQAENFVSELSGGGAPGKGNPVRVYCIHPAGETLPNTGIAGAEVRNQIIEQGRQFTVRAALKNYGGQPVRGLLVNIYFDGHRAAQKEITLGSHALETIDFQIIPERTGIIDGMIEIEDDAFRGDNRRYFAVTVPENIRVLLIDRNEDAAPFLHAVLGNEFSSQLSVVSIGEKEASPVDFKNFDVVVYNGFSQFTQSDVYRLRNFFAGGGGVLIFPSAHADIASFNRTLGAAFSLGEMNAFTGTLLSGNQRDADFLTVDNIDLAHPVFTDMFRAGAPEPELPRIYFSLTVTPGKTSRNVMTLSNGSPFMVETRAGRGAVVLFSSAPALAWNTLPLQGIFAPLLYRTVQYLASVDGLDNAALSVGDPVSFFYAGSVENLQMTAPGGESYRLSPAVASDAFRVDFTGTDSPGIYDFTADRQIRRRFAVNIDARESDLHPAPEERLSRLFGSRQYTVWRGVSDTAERIVASRSGREVTRYFVIAVLFFLLCETIIQYERFKPEEPEDTGETLKVTEQGN